MKTVTSVSGGKTSAMMAIEFPTDHYIFAVVLMDHPISAPKDKGLLRECINRIPHFVASQEADLTLFNMLKLEQELGKRIDWVASEYTLDRFIDNDTDQPSYRSGHKILPNASKRFCTEQTKLNPMFWHCYLNYLADPHIEIDNNGDTSYYYEPLLMNIGYRWDEQKRVANWTCDKDKFKFPLSCSTGLSKNNLICNLYKYKKYEYTSKEWRVTQFPMYEHKISSLDVTKYWLEKGWQYPEVSNCSFCFHHRDVQQQRQAQLQPEKLQWWLAQEKKVGHTFGKRPLEQIISQPLLDVYDHAPCHCTD